MTPLLPSYVNNWLRYNAVHKPFSPDRAAVKPAPTAGQGCSAVSSVGVTHGLHAFLGGSAAPPGSWRAPNLASGRSVQGTENDPCLRTALLSPPPRWDFLPGTATCRPPPRYGTLLRTPILSPCLPGTSATERGTARWWQPGCRQLPCSEGFLFSKARMMLLLGASPRLNTAHVATFPAAMGSKPKVKEGYYSGESHREIFQATKLFQYRGCRGRAGQENISEFWPNAFLPFFLFFFSPSSPFPCIAQKSLSLLSELFRLQGNKRLPKGTGNSFSSKSHPPTHAAVSTAPSKSCRAALGCQQPVALLTRGSPFISGETREKSASETWAVWNSLMASFPLRSNQRAIINMSLL